MSFWKFGNNNHDDESDYIDPITPDFDDDDDDDDGQTLSVDDAALIWLSNGMDEDYTFGYTEDELRDALD